MDGHRNDASPDGDEGQAEDSAGGERIAKVLARAGVASRREVERLIGAGRVAVNGETLTAPGVKVGPGDRVTLDGKPVAAAEPTRLFRYHKPPGLVTSHADPQGRPTVFQALPSGLPRLISVGRLDLNSEGLLLLTNDGGLARQMELPATGLQRRYRARARGRVTQAALDRLASGITVAGVRYGPIEARLEPGHEGSANQWIVVTLAEGKNREVRKVLEALGLAVNRLIRVTYGPYELGNLERGEVEEIRLRPLAGGAAPARFKPARKAPAASTPVVEPKKVYKAGWAKAKAPRKGPARPARSKPQAGSRRGR
jgi:23S rRNA pseudouridine2605 synthase